jgi:hypothetical protein
MLKQEIKVLCEELRISEAQRTSTDLFATSPLPLFPINEKEINNIIQTYITESNQSSLSDDNDGDHDHHHHHNLISIVSSPASFMSLQSSVTKLDDRKKELESALRRLKDAVRELLPRIHQLYLELAVGLDDVERVRLWSLLLPKVNSPSLNDQEKYIEALLKNDPSIPQRFPLSIIRSVILLCLLPTTPFYLIHQIF